MKRQPFGNTIEPVCMYCAGGRPAPDKVMILCRRYGPVAPTYKCKRYRYDPLRRIPKRQPKLPQYEAKDFSLE